MAHQLTESEVLRQLDIPDFRHLTKDKVMSFASLLNDMDPEVAKKAIEQFPEFAKMALDALKDYKGVIEKAFDKNSESSQQCFSIYNEIESALSACAQQEDISFEEKRYYIDKMFEVAKMAEEKDRENKNFTWKMMATFSTVVVAVIGVGAGALGGHFNINLPKPK